MGDSNIWLFGYGSLVNRESAEQTLGRPVGELVAATLRGWRRRWSLLRDNAYCEKTFAHADGSVPDWLLTLNVEPEARPDERVNGVLIAIDETDLPALDVREVRYRRVEVSGSIEASGLTSEQPVVTYTATAHHTAVTPPADALILDTYLAAVENGFRQLGAGELEEFHATTGEPPVPVTSCELVRSDAPPTSPATW